MSDAHDSHDGLILRDLSAATAKRYDVAIVGGGIYGVCLALEAAQRGQRVVLLERGDFGGEVSFSSLRILHGGLRYLQKMDVRRFFESVGERRWFLKHFPDVTGTLPCLMPLYGEGLRRASVFQVALRMNDAMSCRRNAGVGPSHHLNRAKVISADAAAKRFAWVDREGLQGAALWEDGQMINSPRLMMEICRWAASSGATLLNYVEATGLDTADGRVAAVSAKDVQTGEALRFEADVVVNAAGPWCARVSAAMGARRDELFRPGLSFNVLFDREPLSDAAVAVTAKLPGAQTYFLHREGPHLLGGTYQAPAPPPEQRTGPAFEELLRGYVGDYIGKVNQAVPGLGLKREEVMRVYAGLLPVTVEGGDEPTDHPIIHDHGKADGVQGLWSVSGVKYTTARLVAEQTLREIRPAAKHEHSPRPTGLGGLALTGSDAIESAQGSAVLATARSIMQTESVQRLDDLLLRRTGWARDPDVGQRLARRLGPELGFDQTQIEASCVAIGRRLFAEGHAAQAAAV